MSLGKPVIKLCLMEDEMRDFAISEATKALDTSNSEKVCSYPTNAMVIDCLCIVSCIIYEINI